MSNGDADRSRDRGFVGRVAGVVPVATAISLALLYGLGALYKAAELHSAGLSVRETLPLVPVQQLLTKGIAVAYDNAIPLLITLVWLGPWVGMAWTWTRAKALLENADVGDLPAETERGRKDAQGNLSRALSIAEEFEGDVVEAVRAGKVSAEHLVEIEERRERLRGLLSESRKVLSKAQEIEARVAELGPMPGLSSVLRFRGATRRERLTSAMYLFGLVGNVLLVPPPLAIGVAVPFVLFAFPAVRRNVRVFPHYVAASGVFLVLCLLVGVSLSSHPLPSVHLTTVDGKKVEGALIAKTDSTWYLGVGRRGGFTSIDSVQVVAAEVSHGSSAHGRIVIDYIWNGIKDLGG